MFRIIDSTVYFYYLSKFAISQQPSQRMLSIDESESMDMDLTDRNQFLDEAFQYQKCPFCERSFFMGKLAYHLKLCNSERPMFKTPLKSTRGGSESRNLGSDHRRTKYGSQQSNFQINPETNKTNNGNDYDRCKFCKTRLPSFLLQRHVAKCGAEPVYQEIETGKIPVRQNYLRAKRPIVYKTVTTGEDGFQFRNLNRDLQSDVKEKPQEMASPSKNQLPRIRQSARTSEKKALHLELTRHTVRIRDDLRCFRKALEVQKVICPFCERKFSNQASLRHIPICQNLKTNQQKSIALQKRTKDSIVKKRNDVFNSKVDAFIDLPGMKNGSKGRSGMKITTTHFASAIGVLKKQDYDPEA